MKLMKKIAAGAMALVLAMSFVGCQKAENGKEVVAKIGDREITREDVAQQIEIQKQNIIAQYGEEALNSDQGKQIFKQIEVDVVTQFVDRELLLMKGEEAGFTSTDEKVKERFEEVKSQFPSVDEFNKRIKEIGLTEDILNEQIKQDLVVEQYIDQITADIAVTDEEVADFYKENINQFTQSPRAKIAHIVVESEDDIKKIRKEFDDGAAFEDLAKKYGTDATKDKGGDLGVIAFDSPNYDADFLAAASKLAEGEVSQPVKTQFGWHLIKVTELQKDPQVTPLDEVKDDIKKYLEDNQKGEKISAELDKLRTENKVEILITAEVEQPAPSTDEQKSDDTKADDTKADDTKADDAGANN